MDCYYTSSLSLWDDFNFEIAPRDKKRKKNLILTYLNPKPMDFMVWFQGYDYHCNNTLLVQR